MMHKGVSVSTGTQGLCAGEMLYHFIKGQPTNSDYYGTLVKITAERLVEANAELPTDIEAYLRWASEHDVMELSAARRWTAGDFHSVRGFITEVARSKSHVWIDYDTRDSRPA